MNRRRIQSRLNNAFENWVQSIQDEHVRTLVLRNSVITGGAIVSLLLNEEPKDYDVYFRDKETTLAVAQYYVAQFNQANEGRKNRLGYEHKAFVLDGAKPIEEQVDEAGEDRWYSRMLYNMSPERVKIIVRSDGVAGTPDAEKQLAEGDDLVEEPVELPPEPGKKDKKEKPKPYRPIFLSTNAVTLSDKIQLVVRFYGDPETIHETFDFIHCCNYWTSWDNTLTLNPDALEAILDRRLVYSGSRYPLCSIIRLRKFLKKGWTVNAGQILKMCFQLSELDLGDPDVLEDQLIGVDTLYFKAFIEQVRMSQENADNKTEFRVDQTYVATLIDKIFG